MTVGRSAGAVSDSDGREFATDVVLTSVRQYECPVSGTRTRIEDGGIDPSFVVIHEGAPTGGPELYETFSESDDDCIEAVLAH